MFARHVPYAPDPLGLARALERSHAPGRGMMWSRGKGEFSYVAAFPDATSDALDPAAHEPTAAGTFAHVPRWLGVVPYECLREQERPSWTVKEAREPPWIARPMWARYPAAFVVRHVHGDVWVVADDEAAARRLVDAVSEVGVAACDQVDRASGFDLEMMPSAGARERHIERVTEIVERIRAGEIYQLNYARRIDVAWRAGSPLDVVAAMTERAPSEFACHLQLSPNLDLCASSPELLLDARTEPTPSVAKGAPPFRQLETEPIKGTAPRGHDHRDDRRRSTALDADPKERAELAMIVDVVRNDLNRVCRPGSVRVIRPPAVRACGPVFHRMATIGGRVREGQSRAAVLRAVLPSGSVTGAPKIRAMEVIGQLEEHRRGLYTGGYGMIRRDGRLTLAMAIRCLLKRDDRARYHTGGGIVVRSEAEREWEETNWKAAQLFDVLRGGAAPR